MPTLDTLNLTPLDIALVVLCISGIWAIAELALTLRSTRKKVSELSTSVNETILEIQPIIAKLDGVVDDVNPAVKQVEPLLGKVGNAVDAVTLDLIRVDDILGDVSSVTGTASNATISVSGAVNRVAASASDAATGIIGRITGRAPKSGSEPAKIQAKPAHAPKDEDAQDQAGSDVILPVDPDQNYFTYAAGQNPDEETFKPVLKRTRKKDAKTSKSSKTQKTSKSSKSSKGASE